MNDPCNSKSPQKRDCKLDAGHTGRHDDGSYDAWENDAESLRPGQLRELLSIVWPTINAVFTFGLGVLLGWVLWGM